MSIVDKIKTARGLTAPFLQNKVSEIYGSVKDSQKEYNPFLNKDGSLFNEYLNYQNILDNPNVAQKTKQFIQSATDSTTSGAFNRYTSADHAIGHPCLTDG